MDDVRTEQGGRGEHERKGLGVGGRCGGGRGDGSGLWWVGRWLRQVVCGSGREFAGEVRSPAAAAAPQVPTVAMGQTVTVHTTPDGLITKAAGSYEVTLTGLKTATSVTDQSDGYTAKADAGKVIGCLSLKVKNTGTVASELYPFTDPQWQGASGQVAGSELASGVSCSSIGVAGDDLSGAPDPGPGQFATGSDAVEFPTGGGQLVFVDRSGAQLFKVAVPG